jgi:MFS family permease
MTRLTPTVTYYLISALFTLAAALIWGVNTLFLLDAGLDIFGVFLSNAAFTAGMVAFEVPTGVLADTVGRRASFLWSVVVLAVTTIGYILVARAGGGVLPFAAVSVVMGLGFTFYSGAVEAWLVDALDATGSTASMDSVFARGSIVTGGAMLVGTLAGGFLGDVDLALPYVVRSIFLVAAFGLAWVAMRDIGFTPKALRLGRVVPEMRSVLHRSIAFGWQVAPVRLVMFVSLLQWGFVSWAFYAWQPYFLELLGRDAIWVAGAAASLIAGSMIVGNAIVEWLSRFCGRRSTLLLWAAGVQSAAAVGIGLTDSFAVALGLFVCFGAAMGVGGPVKQALLHASIPSQERASVVSFDSMFGNGGGIGFQTGLGWLARAQSIELGYVVGGTVTVAALPLLAALRRVGGAADRIVGRTAGIESACAAQGLPHVSGVDAVRKVSGALPAAAAVRAAD